MIPIYSVVSFLNYMFYRKAVYFEVLRDCYEAFAISSFFALLCHYIAPNLHDQKNYFRSVKPKNWFWGVFGFQYLTGGENKGMLRKPRSGLTWFNVIWLGIFQYCFVRVFFTIVSVVSEAFDRYCAASLSPAFAHIWVLAFESLSVTVAMFMVVQFYIQLKDDLVEHRPFLKVLSIKLVIFFSFWQTIVISLLSSDRGPLKPTNTLAYQDIKIGIPSVMLCIEMAAFSVMHMFAYPWKPYRIEQNNDPLVTSGAGFSGGLPEYKGGPFGIKAILDAFNPWDIIKALARAFRWMFVGAKHRHTDASYHPAKPLEESALSNTGPSFAATGDAATELKSGRGRAETYTAEDDRAGLLGHSQAPGRAPNVSHTGYDPVIGGDGILRSPQAVADSYTVGGMHTGIEEEDTGYHPHGNTTPPPGTAISTREGIANPHWNHWAGVDMRDRAHTAAEDAVGRPPIDPRNESRR